MNYYFGIPRSSGPDNFALFATGALGTFQFTPGAWSDFGEGNLGNATDLTKASKAASRMLDWIKAKYGTSDPDELAAY